MEFDLGTGIVLDAKNMYEGMHVEIMGGDGKKRLFAITKVDANRIVMRPILGWELLSLRIARHKVLVIISLVIPIALGIIVLLLRRQ